MSAQLVPVRLPVFRKKVIKALKSVLSQLESDKLLVSFEDTFWRVGGIGISVNSLNDQLESDELLASFEDTFWRVGDIGILVNSLNDLKIPHN